MKLQQFPESDFAFFPSQDQYSNFRFNQGIFNKHRLSRDGEPGSTYTIFTNGNIAEGASDENGLLPFTFVIRRSGNLSSQGEIQFRLKSGSAKIGSDVQGSKNYQTVIFSPEDEDYDPSKPYHDKHIKVPILDDDLVESDEYFFGQIRRAFSSDQVPETIVRATILNDDLKSTYSLEAVDQKVEEGKKFILKIKRDVADKPAKISLDLRGNTAELGEDLCLLDSELLDRGDICLGDNADFTDEDNADASDEVGGYADVADQGKKYPESLSVDFGVGDFEKNVNIKAFADNVVEGDEAFFVRIKSSSKTDQIQGGNLRLNISDANKPSVYSIVSAAPVVEGEDISFVVERSSNEYNEGKFKSDGAFYFWTKRNTAKSEDFELLERKKYIIPYDQTTLVIPISTIDDDNVESDESLIGFLKPFHRSDRTSGSPKFAIIQDNDIPVSYELKVLDQVGGNIKSEFDEGSTAFFQVTRTGGNSGTGSVQLKIRGTTAKTDKDFIRPRNLMVEFAEGESTQVVEVNFIDDDIVEPKESLYAQLKAVNKDDKISGGMNKLEILDNDIYATYELTSAQIDGLNSGQVIEGGISTFKIKRTGTTGFLSKPSKVVFRTQSGSAKRSDDYAASKKQEIQFDAGQDTVYIPVEIIQDYRVERNEDFYASIRSFDKYDRIINRRQKVTILDDDTSAEFTLTQTSPFNVREGQSFNFQVSRVGGAGRTSSVLLWTSNGDAKSGQHYEKLAPLQLDFEADGTDFVPLSLSTLPNSIEDSSKYFYLNIRPLDRSDSVENSQIRLEINDL